MEVLDTLQMDGVLTPGIVSDNRWVPNQVPFCAQEMTKVLTSPIVWGSKLGKNAHDRLKHLWCFEDVEKRDGWENKKYRTLYQMIVQYWNEFLGDQGWEWNDNEFLKFFVRRCWIWPNTTTSKWWTKSATNKTRVWQGLNSSLLWCEYPALWSLVGPCGNPRSFQPHPFDCKLITIEPDDLISQLLTTSGKTESLGHFAIFQYNWSWGDSQWRRELPVQYIETATGELVPESSVTRSVQEEKDFQELWNNLDIVSSMFRDGVQRWYSKKGYLIAGEGEVLRRQRQEEYRNNSKWGRQIYARLEELKLN